MTRPTLTTFVLLAVATAGCGDGARPPRTDAPAAATPATATVERVDLPATFEAGGIIRTRASATLASRTLATVTAVHVRPGDRFRRGATLITLDSRDLRARLAQAAADVAARSETITAADRGVAAADAALALARATHARLRALHEKRAATTHELDEAVAALGAAEAEVGARRALLAAAVSARDAARAAEDAAAIALADAAVTAPFDGVVSHRHVDPGDMASPGAPLLQIEDPASLRLEVTLDEARARGVLVGGTATVLTDDEAPLIATVGEIARLDPAAHSVLIRLDLPTSTRLRSGAFVRARFPGPSRSALTVPAAAVVRRGQLTFVFAVDADGRVRLQPIAGTEAAEGRFEIFAGLAAGDRVILDAPATLSDGAILGGGAGR